MPGANCAIFGCTTSRRKKYQGLSIFKLPVAKDQESSKWRSEILNIITKDRVVDPDFQEQIMKNNVYICELHFSPEQMYIYQHKKSLKEGAIPLLALPQKSIGRQAVKERSTCSINKRDVSSKSISCLNQQHYKFYNDFPEFTKRIINLKLPKWAINNDKDNSIVRAVYAGKYTISEYELFVDVTLSYSIRVYGWMIPDTHDIYKKYKRSLFNVTFSNLIHELMAYSLCCGVKYFDNQASSFIQKHVIPKKFDYNEYQQLETPLSVQQVEYDRSKECELLLPVNDQSSDGTLRCQPCKNAQSKFYSDQKRKLSSIAKPAHINAPVKLTSPERLKLTLQSQRLTCIQLEEQIKKMQTEIKNNGKTVDEGLSRDFQDLFSKTDQNEIPPFMKLFWSEQQKYLQTSNPSTIRYHPMIIKYCLNLASKSASSYNDLRYNHKNHTGVLVLPSLRTLRDYKNYIRPQRGFNDKVMEDLKKRVDNFSNAEKFIGILLDEMKIQEDLVWDKNTGELIGFVDLGMLI